MEYEACRYLLALSQGMGQDHRSPRRANDLCVEGRASSTLIGDLRSKQTETSVFGPP